MENPTGNVTTTDSTVTESDSEAPEFVPSLDQLLRLRFYRTALVFPVRVDDLLAAQPADPADAQWRGIMRTLRRLQQKGELGRAATILSALIR